MGLWKGDKRRMLCFQPSALFTALYIKLLVAVCCSADIETPCSPPYKPQVVRNNEIWMSDAESKFIWSSQKWTTECLRRRWGAWPRCTRGGFHQLLAFSQCELSFYANTKAVPTGHQVYWLIDALNLNHFTFVFKCLPLDNGVFTISNLSVSQPHLLANIDTYGQMKEGSSSSSTKCTSSFGGRQTPLVESCEVVILCLFSNLKKKWDSSFYLNRCKHIYSLNFS